VRVASWVLVGRSPEQAALEQLVGQTLSGRGGVVSVDGAQGMGRSRLFRELCIDARLRGLRTLSVRASDCSREGELLGALARGLLTVAPDVALTTLSEPGRNELLSGIERAVPDAAAPAEDATGDSVERWLARQEAVAGWICAVARKKPLLLAIDDAHLLHPRDALVLVLMAQQAPRCPLLLGLTRPSAERCAPGVEQVALMGVSLSLQPLTPAAVELLLRSAFGDVPNRTRLSQWLTSAGQGNPGRVMRLLRSLVARGSVREVGGTWTLPADPSEVSAADEPNEGADAALPELSAAARALAQVLAVHGRALPEAVCARLSPHATPQSTRALLQQLVAGRVITETGEGHRIAHNAAQQALLAELDDARREAVHLELAGALSAADPLSFEAIEQNRMQQVTTRQLVQAISVGLHLIRGGADERGSKLLRVAAVELTVRGEGLADAALDLEAAVETHRARGVPWYRYTALLPALSLAGTYIDYRLNYRYGGELIDRLEQAAGLRWARKLARYLGGHVALWLCMALAAAYFVLLPSRRPTTYFRELLLGLIGIGTASMSVCTVLQDKDRARLLSAQLDILRYFPRRHAVRRIHEFHRSLLDLAHGDYRGARDKAHDTLAFVRSPDAAGLPSSARDQLEAGLLTLLGPIDAMRTDDSVQRDLEAIDQLRTFTSRQTRTTALVAYHGHRGERAQFAKHLEELDRLAAETGAVWRHDVQVPRLLWSSQALCEDVMALKRSVQQLGPLADLVPSVARLRDVTHACYLSERGLPQEALIRYRALFEAIDRERPTLRDVQYLGAYARILRKAGQPRRAVEVCEAALRALTEEEREFRLMTFCAELELSLSLFEVGEQERAIVLLDRLLAAQAAHDNPLLHGLAHGARAQLALALNDRASFIEHLEAMRKWLRRTDNPPLFAQYQRLADRTQAPLQSTSLAPPPRKQRAPHDVGASIPRYADASERAERALALALRELGAVTGYLFVKRDDALALAAATSSEQPPAGCLRELARLMAAPRGHGFETELLKPPDNSNGARPSITGLTTLVEETQIAPLAVAWPDRKASAFLLVPPALGPHEAIGAVVVLEEQRPLHAIPAAFLAQLAEAVALSPPPGT
jgi:AAA ATPase domain